MTQRFALGFWLSLGNLLSQAVSRRGAAKLPSKFRRHVPRHNRYYLE